MKFRRVDGTALIFARSHEARDTFVVLANDSWSSLKIGDRHELVLYFSGQPQRVRAEVIAGKTHPVLAMSVSPERIQRMVSNGETFGIRKNGNDLFIVYPDATMKVAYQRVNTCAGSAFDPFE